MSQRAQKQSNILAYTAAIRYISTHELAHLDTTLATGDMLLKSIYHHFEKADIKNDNSLGGLKDSRGSGTRSSSLCHPRRALCGAVAMLASLKVARVPPDTERFSCHNARAPVVVVSPAPLAPA